MADWMTLLNLSIGSAGLALTVLGLVVTAVYRPIDRPTRRYFFWFFSLLSVYTGSIFMGQALLFVSGGVQQSPLSIFLESLSSSMLMPVLTTYLLHLCGEDWRTSRLFRVTLGLWGVYAALLVYTQFSRIFYFFDESGVYHRGPLYPLLLASPALIMVINLWGLWRRHIWLSRKQLTALLVYLLAPLVSMLIQMAFYGPLTIALGTILAALVMFLFLLSDQQEQFVRETEANAQKEFEIRILQMRPHFIYNALTSIYYITGEDREKGMRVIRDFTIYLRRVFDSVVRREPIPFEEELEHTRAYLCVEQARFESQLSVTFDTPHIDFRLPPLTLQPIVENAVKHGMDPEIDHLSILIRTRRLAGGSEITVENDGADFVPMLESAEGVGLASTVARLRRMCGGNLKISPRSGGGTVVTLWIPNRGAGR